MSVQVSMSGTRLRLLCWSCRKCVLNDPRRDSFYTDAQSYPWIQMLDSVVCLHFACLSTNRCSCHDEYVVVINWWMRLWTAFVLRRPPVLCSRQAIAFIVMTYAASSLKWRLTDRLINNVNIVLPNGQHVAVVLSRWVGDQVLRLDASVVYTQVIW